MAASAPEPPSALTAPAAVVASDPSSVPPVRDVSASMSRLPSPPREAALSQPAAAVSPVAPVRDSSLAQPPRTAALQQRVAAAGASPSARQRPPMKPVKFTVSSSVVVADQRAESKFVAYRVNVAVTHAEGNIVNTLLIKRYSQFEELHSELERLFPRLRLPELPPKHLFSTSDEVIAERCMLLPRYLNHLAPIEAIYHSKPFHAFLTSSLPIKEKKPAPARNQSPAVGATSSPQQKAPAPAALPAAPESRPASSRDPPRKPSMPEVPASMPAAAVMQTPAEPQKNPLDWPAGVAPPPPATDSAPPPRPPPRAMPARNASAAWDYAPSGEFELELKAGDVVQLLSTEDATWWLGKKGAAIGYFPKAFVTLSI